MTAAQSSSPLVDVDWPAADIEAPDLVVLDASRRLPAVRERAGQKCTLAPTRSTLVVVVSVCGSKGVA
jgi:hypothetical protein